MVAVSATVLSGSVLQLYFNQVIGLQAAWVGLALALTILVDSVIDPLIGRFSDNLRTRWGRRHMLMYASALPAALGIVLYAIFSLVEGRVTGWAHRKTEFAMGGG